MKIDQSFRFIGFRDRETVRSLRYHANINLCIWDGFAQLEAMIAGRPIVCGYNYFESIVNNVNGMSITNWHDDHRGYADAITCLLENPDIGDEFGRRAREEVLSRYSLEYTDAIKKKIYADVLSAGQQEPVRDNG